jgi:hypothetical protein
VNSAVSVPEEVELFTRRALGKKAEGRPATADGFAKQLREALDAGYGEHPLGSTSAERPSPESSGKVSRRLVATFVILCALIAVVALAGWYFLDQRASSFQKDTELALEDTDLKVCTTPFLNIGKKADEVLSDFREVLQKPALRSEQKRFHKLGELLEKGIEQWGFRGNEHCQQKQRTEEQDDDMLDRQQRATFLLVKLGNSFLRITSDRLPTEANILEDQAHAVVECSLSSYLCSPLLVASRGSAAPNSRIEVSAQLACRRPTKDGGHETLTQCLERTHRPTDEFQLHLERSPDTAVYVFLSDTDGHFNAKRISGRDGPIDSPWMSFGERTNGDALRIQVVASVETPEWLENLRGESFDPVQGKLGPEAQTLRGQLTMAQLDAKTDMSDTPDVDDSITGTGTGLAVVDIALERETAASP